MNLKVKEVYKEIDIMKVSEQAWKEKCAELELEVKK